MIITKCHPKSEYRHVIHAGMYLCPFCGSKKLELTVRKMKGKDSGHDVVFGCDGCGTTVGMGLFGFGLEPKWVIQYCRKQYRHWKCNQKPGA